MPRLTAILATQAPIALVIRGGPNRWHHILRWHLDTGVLEPGAWVRKNVYPERWDFSPDGRLLTYFISGGYNGKYEVWSGIARAPWIAPIHSWVCYDTYGQGNCFVVNDETPHTFGEAWPIIVDGTTYTIRSNSHGSYVNERRRGWTEAPDSNSKDDDLRRQRTVLHKPQAGDGVDLAQQLLLRLTRRWTSARRNPDYKLQQPNSERLPLDKVTWADWDHRGHLLTGTADGMLRRQIVSMDADTIRFETVEQHDLSNLTPDPQPPPEWASRK